MVTNWPHMRGLKFPFEEQQHFVYDGLLAGTTLRNNTRAGLSKEVQVVTGSRSGWSSLECCTKTKLNQHRKAKSPARTRTSRQTSPREKLRENWAAPLETSRSHNAQCHKPERAADINHWTEDAGVTRIMRLVQPFMARGPQRNPLLWISSQLLPPLLSSRAESQRQSRSDVHF